MIEETATIPNPAFQLVLPTTEPIPYEIARADKTSPISAVVKPTSFVRYGDERVKFDLTMY